ncbi:MAG: hypothetical protein WCG03_07230, partial [Kiritimatiellales bacterium]
GRAKREAGQVERDSLTSCLKITAECAHRFGAAANEVRRRSQSYRAASPLRVASALQRFAQSCPICPPNTFFCHSNIPSFRYSM